MKPWTEEIARHVAHWTARCQAQNIKWLPRFAYHFTEVHNAARILTDGLILSRERAVAEGRMVNDNAAAEVISETPASHKRFARLYFRPRTPTQYSNEGILPPERRRYQQAHCPVPIFFCFDLAKLLEQDDVLFSDGSMGRPEVRFGDSLELFQAIPFEFVYHDRTFTKDDKSKIVFHRHAEILVPDQLPLTHLAGVACRTDAERRTLLHLLADPVRASWQSKIWRVGDPLYFRNRPHLDSVYCVDNVIRLRINANYSTLPVGARAKNLQTGRTWSWAGNHTGVSELVLEFPRETRGKFELEVRLYECVAFRGIIGLQDDLPF